MNAAMKVKLDYWIAFNEYVFEDKAYAKVFNVSFEGFCTINPSPPLSSSDGYDVVAVSVLRYNQENIL